MRDDNQLSWRGRLRRLLLEFTPHGCGDSWMVAQRLLGLFLLAALAAGAATWLLHGCTVITVNGGPGNIESDKAAIVVKPSKERDK